MSNGLSLESMHKCKIIGDINDMLLKYGQDQLCTDDFDVLYSLDVQALREAKMNIKAQLKSIVQPIKNLRY